MNDIDQVNNVSIEKDFPSENINYSTATTAYADACTDKNTQSVNFDNNVGINDLNDTSDDLSESLDKTNSFALNEDLSTNKVESSSTSKNITSSTINPPAKFKRDFSSNEDSSTVNSVNHISKETLGKISGNENSHLPSKTVEDNCPEQNPTSYSSPTGLQDNLTDDQSNILTYKDHIKEKSIEASTEVQNLMEENLEKFSPKKEPMQANTELHGKDKTDSLPLNMLHRKNPFNHTEIAESTDVWEMRVPLESSHSNLANSSNHQFSSHNYPNSVPAGPIYNSLSNQNFKSEESSIQNISANLCGTSHPQFDLMPPTHQICPDSTSSSLHEDVDAVVQEAKMNAISKPVADPWVKMDRSEVASTCNSFGGISLMQSNDHNKSAQLPTTSQENHIKSKPQQPSFIRPLIEAVGPCEPSDLIEGIIFTAYYLGSTQLQSEKNPGKNARMMQAQEAVSRIKAPEGESQPSVEVDLFISTDKVKVLNADTQEAIMDHTLRSVSYIADIDKLLVIMAKRRAPQSDSQEQQQILRDPKPQRLYKIICHVFSSHDSHFIAQAIGQAFNVAYQQFLSANGIEPQTLTRDDYNQLLDLQEMYHDDLVHYSKRENLKDIWVEKNKGESFGVVIVESGWGSIIPTAILANLQHGGPAERCGKLNIGDQIMTINGTSLVGLPLTTCQSIIKGLRSQTIAHLKIVSCPPVVTVLIKRPDLKYQLGFSVQDGIICSLMRGGIAERGGVRVGHRIIEINGQSVVATSHEKIVQTLVSSIGEIQMKTMPAMMYRLLTGQEQPVYI